MPAEAVQNFIWVLSPGKNKTYSCGESKDCPEEYPCCSSTGICGTGTYCLGGCDPRYSYNLTACIAQPVCQQGNYTFTKEDLITSSEYLGDYNETKWTYEGHVMDYNDSIIMALPKNGSGTVISSTFFVWYGNVTTRFKSSHNAGVISASILFSDVQDEIDLEIIGNALKQPQSNFYYEGVLNYTNMVNLSTSDAFENWHSYTVDWQEEQITWYIDGVEGRTLKKVDTYNETTDEYMYPQTPSRIQLSLWPGGDSTQNSAGVVAWAGGAINWNASDFTDPGYLFATIGWVNVQCYDPPSGTLIEGDLSYIFTDPDDFSQDSVMITDNDTIIDNLGQTGFDIGKNKDAENENNTSIYTTTYSSRATKTVSSSSLPAGYSSEFFQDIRTATESSSNGAADVTVINRGYDKPRFKYGVILTPRVKHDLSKDFLIEAAEEAFLAICLSPQTDHLNPIRNTDDGSTATKKLLESYSLGSLDFTEMEYSDDLDLVFEAYRKNELQSRILGTICVKNYQGLKDEKEVTGFTSFYPGLSAKLMEFMACYCKDQLRVAKLWVDIIEEHNLKEYYEKLGFFFISRETCHVDPITHNMLGKSLEDGIKASRDFHVALMERDL
ncbi:hypothetical protein FOA43_000950 [Brettanomyces nanus]|uniref:GH16 domain-containing protein n=1 Tax=Eeniella nana TaxID=13502 RepID=A0A875RY76_EENNA|nr:uncharacterized protein FOA43_000950 [Brettanomyces nanus]QPG73638.1 hypothetical protein FOA43_000950 [Brettanomyces nanus]